MTGKQLYAWWTLIWKEMLTSIPTWDELEDDERNAWADLGDQIKGQFVPLSDVIKVVNEIEGVIHLDVCPECGETNTSHLLDPPNFCRHEYERRVPVRYAPLDVLTSGLEHLGGGK